MRAASETETRVMGAEKGLKEVLDRLCDLSVERAYDPFRDFEWPASVPEQGMWMSEDLLSVHGTPYMAELTEEQRWSLSRWELVNFFSYNVHGIKDLMQTVLSCIHKSGHETTSEYFHHFLDEENKHMWFFAEFCSRYGGKIYVSQSLPFPTFAEEDIQSFIAFAKILIAEQIGDFYNVRMMADESLHPIVRKLNRVHHEDESRHIAMGLKVVRLMYETIADKHSKEARQKIEAYLLGYMQFYMESFYNPSAYRDAGLQEPYEWRRKLIADQERQKFHEKVLRRTTSFFRSNGIIAQKAMQRDAERGEAANGP